MPSASRSVIIRARPEKAFEVIRDYARYPEFLPEVKQVRILGRRDLAVDVWYEVQLIRKIHYSLRMEERGPTSITWSFLEGDLLKENRGSWELSPEGEGSTRATYSVELGLGPWVPKAILNGLVETSLPAMLSAFARRIESQQL